MPVNRFKRRQTGASLLEVLVSLVILAIGILGMSALLTNSLKSNQRAYLRTQAVVHAMDMAERVRANRAGAAAGHYNNPTPLLSAGCGAPAGCTPAQMAAHDVAQWQALLARGLPTGNGVVCRDSTPDDGSVAAPACDGAGEAYSVKIWWDDDRDGSAERNYVMTFRP